MVTTLPRRVVTAVLAALVLLVGAASLPAQEPVQASVDRTTVRVNESFTFVLRADMGLSTKVAQQANRELKDRFGVVAYVIAGLQAISQPEPIVYQLTVDGQEILRFRDFFRKR